MNRRPTTTFRRMLSIGLPPGIVLGALVLFFGYAWLGGSSSSPFAHKAHISHFQPREDFEMMDRVEQILFLERDMTQEETDELYRDIRKLRAHYPGLDEDRWESGVVRDLRDEIKTPQIQRPEACEMMDRIEKVLSHGRLMRQIEASVAYYDIWTLVNYYHLDEDWAKKFYSFFPPEKLAKARSQCAQLTGGSPP